jgi:hypothetical protein
VDLTNDGVKDVISGCYPGELYLFAGHEDGTFAKGLKVKNKHGKEINVGRAAALFAADWDRDGDLDLVVGNIEGKVCWIPNEGQNGGLIFGDPIWMEAAGRKIAVQGRNAGPCVADWDRDGNPDLVVGCGDGSVRFYRNTTDQGVPVLEAPVELVAKSRTFAQRRGQKPAGNQPPQGYRAKICVADYNDDGLPDLLLGDCCSVQEPAPKLTAEQEAERDRLLGEQNKIRTGFAEIRKRVEEKLLADCGYTLRTVPKEKRNEVIKAWSKLLREDPGYKDYAKKSQELYKKLRPLSPRRSTHGYVWVFLRKSKRWL